MSLPWNFSLTRIWPGGMRAACNSGCEEETAAILDWSRHSHMASSNTQKTTRNCAHLFGWRTKKLTSLWVISTEMDIGELLAYQVCSISLTNPFIPVLRVSMCFLGKLSRRQLCTGNYQMYAQLHASKWFSKLIGHLNFVSRFSLQEKIC